MFGKNSFSYSALFLLILSIPQLSISAPTKEAAETASAKTIAIAERSTLQRSSIGLGIGQTILMGDFDKHGENGITADLFYSYSASYSFDFLANLHISNHDFRDEETTISGLAFAIKGKLFQFDSFSPFILGGLGFYGPQVERRINGESVKSETKFTFGSNLGVGLDLKLNSRITFGILAHYHNPFDVKQEIGSDLEGSYTKVLLTTFYTF